MVAQPKATTEGHNLSRLLPNQDRHVGVGQAEDAAVLFDQRPAATVRTALAVYRGREGFERDYPSTAYTNVGSEMQPAYMPSLCYC
jgi:hypothetical protein